MTHSTYTQQAIADYSVDEQAVAQAELAQYMSQQAQAVAPEEFTCIEISFYDHEIYSNGQLIAQITYDHKDFVTQPWLVIVNSKEEFRANTWAKCYRYICTHHKDCSLPVTEPFEQPCTTDNRAISHIFKECQRYGLEVLNDGIYKDDVKLGQVGYTRGNWWVIQGSSVHKQYSNSVFDAVRVLVETRLRSCEELLDLPVDELTALDWQRLQAYGLEPELIAA
ncbi:hypothetical protein LC593_32140 [Nostoc sp. CHAB 5844]|nr:hypothetical protein [Nostoc sp. CHAB 5844]